MSPFRTRTNPSPAPPAANSPSDPSSSSPPPPSRIPSSRSTSSLALFRTRSRGNDLDAHGVRTGHSLGSSPEQQTIRAVRRVGDPEDDFVPPQQSAYRTYTTEETRRDSHEHLAPQREPNKLSKWLSRSSSSSSSAHSHPPSDRPAPPLQPVAASAAGTKTRTTRSRSIGSLNLLSNALHHNSPSKPSSKKPSRPSTSDSSSAAPSPAFAPSPPTIEISSSPSTTFSPSSPSPSPSPASSPAVSHPPSSTASSPAASFSSIFTDSAPSAAQPGGSAPLRRGSLASNSSQSSSLRGLHLSLKKPRSGSGRTRGAGKTRPSTEEVLDEWATAELSEGDEEGRQISEEMVRALSRGSEKSGSIGSVGSSKGEGGGVLAKSLRRTRSGLKLFSGGVGVNGARSREQSGATEPVAGGMEGSELLVEPIYGSAASSGSNGGGFGGSSMLDIASTSPTPTSAVFPSSSGGSSGSNNPLHPSQQQQQQHNVAGRIGGWFSSMLHGGGNGGAGGAAGTSSASSSSTHLPLVEPFDPQAVPSDSSAPVSPDKTRRGVLPSSGSPGPSRFSPHKKGSSSSVLAPSSSPSGGRLGVFDRVLDRAAQYFFDSDSRADECEDEIWVLGVRHPGFVPPPLATPVEGEEDWEAGEEVEGEEGAGKAKKRRSLPSLGRKSRSPVKQRKAVAPPVPSLPSTHAAVADPFLVSSSPSPAAPTLPSPPADLAPPHTINGWPASFYLDFYSRIALTYRSGFIPIPCAPSSSSAPSSGVGAVLSSLGASIGRGGRTGISDVRQVGEEGLSSDTGWGCMLRTGQSLLANALTTVHLGRDWRRPLPPTSSTSNASSSSTNLLIPSSSAPPVPSVAVYARLLALFLDTPASPSISPFSVHAFAAAGKTLGKNPGEWFGPSTAAGAIKALVNAYEPAGFRVVSCVDGAVYESEVAKESGGWEKPVLVLVNVRLGIDGVNPIYYEAIKGIFRLPQTVGIAGGRPSSSYYFVAAQGNSLFYIDPHHPRPAVPVVQPPKEVEELAGRTPLSPKEGEQQAKGERRTRKRVDTQETAKGVADSFVTIAAPTQPPSSSSRSPSPSPPSPAPCAPASSDGPVSAFLLSSYPDAAWSTYHTEKVRKCALNSLDPSMLLGFLVRDEKEWKEFRKGVEELFHSTAPIFSIAAAPPRWMRRSTSSAAPPPSATTASTPSHTAALAATAADDSFDDLAATPSVDGSPALPPLQQQEQAAEADEESSTGFSEPDDWELDSTDGLSSGSNSNLNELETSGNSSSGRDKPAASSAGWEGDSPASSSPAAASSVAVAMNAGAAVGEEEEGQEAPALSSSPAPVVVEKPNERPGKGGERLEEDWEGV
ncbi:hypothetical protein JCM8547_006020 [Rhodosporidiobolus lusitaniae]